MKTTLADCFFFSWNTTDGRSAATRQSKTAARRSPRAIHGQEPVVPWSRRAYAQIVKPVTTTANRATMNQEPIGSKLALIVAIPSAMLSAPDQAYLAGAG